MKSYQSYSKLDLVAVALFLFWYLSMFPGRLGYDYALLTRMVQQGESTAWWGANYFWIFKLLTFNASNIFIISLFGLATLTVSMRFFIWSLPMIPSKQKKILVITMATPLYGVFGTTVSHDVFQTSGLLLLTGLLIRHYQNKKVFEYRNLTVILSAFFFLITTQTGVIISIFFCLLIFIIQNRRLAAVGVIFTIATVFISNIGIQSSNKVESLAGTTSAGLLLVDLKCVVQHPEAGVTEAEWRVLEKYAPRSSWLTPTNCSNPDDLARPLKLNPEALKIDRELVQIFLSVVSRSPAIVFMSHVQRSRVALPPPFFQPPTNQISWDVTVPIGLGTNVALQQGPELLHPSVDEPSVAFKPRFLKPLEIVAQVPTLIMNQASWFWGWGGLWLWPIFIYLLRMRLPGSLRGVVSIMSPTLILHSLLFVVGPSSLSRYVMSTIIQGFILTLSMLTTDGKSK